jgi:poly-gamma-glutamate synthesis protein (capsule biosynthesis protein)
MTNLKIALIGDVMCGDSFYTLGQGVSSALDRHGAGFLPPEIVSLFRGQDMVLFNMESPLSNHGRREYSLRRLHMRGRPEAAAHLARWGMTCANVANNHILEQGLTCAMDTVRHLREAGIATVGGGREGRFEPGLQVADFEIKGHRLSVLGLCLLDEKYAFAGGGAFGGVLDAVRSLTWAGRTVLVSLHWGKELMDRPTSQQRQMAAALIESGASVVAGHHPHVMQGIQCSGGRLVAYSLGNFIFDSFMADCSWSVIVTAELAGRDVVRWGFLPIIKDRDHRPILAQGPEHARLTAEAQRRCALVAGAIASSEEQQTQYAADFAAADAAARKKLWVRLIRTLPRKRPIFWPQVFLRPIQRRLGKW